MVDILLALFGFARTLYGGFLVKRIVTAAALAFVLVIVVSILISVLLAGAFYSVFLTLLHHGFEPMGAYGIAGGLLLLTILVIAAATLQHIKGMFFLPQRILKEKFPLAAKAQDVLEAFLQGFNENHAKK